MLYVFWGVMLLKKIVWFYMLNIDSVLGISDMIYVF